MKLRILRLKLWLHAHMCAWLTGFRLETIPPRYINRYEANNKMLRRFNLYAGVSTVDGLITIWHESPGSPVWYAAAMHEIGHCNRLSQSFLYANCANPVDAAYLGEELQAWKWARENAIYWDDEMDAVCKLAMESYYDAFVEHITKRLFGQI